MQNTRHNSSNCHQPPGHQFVGGFLFKKQQGLKMKKYILVCGAVVALGVGRASWAATIMCAASHCMDLDVVTVNDVSAGCQRKIKTCYGDYAIETCGSCATGYTKISASAVVPGCIGTYTYSDCQENCAGCVNCVSAKQRRRTGVPPDITAAVIMAHRDVRVARKMATVMPVRRR